MLRAEIIPWPSVSEHPAEAAFQEARHLGEAAIAALKCWRIWGTDDFAEDAAFFAKEAASHYHLGVILSGRRV